MCRVAPTCLGLLAILYGTLAIAQSPRSNTDWFHDARWGVMTHYLVLQRPIVPPTWNRPPKTLEIRLLASGGGWLLASVVPWSFHEGAL